MFSFMKWSKYEFEENKIREGILFNNEVEARKKYADVFPNYNN